MKTFRKSNQLLKKAEQIIPLGLQTFSKSYLQFTKGASPLFITHGKGSHVWDVDGNSYIDFVSALLPIILGYQYKAVDNAIRKQLNKGITFSLATPIEYELSKLLVGHIPCAEMVRFGKNGSDATTGAIRLSRAVTGKDMVAVCGYHGWHDWYIGSTTRNLGVPKSTQKMTHKFKYNNIESLEKLFKKHKNKFAAIILEPMNTDEPKDNFLQKVRSLSHKHGALLIFDEVITGFRWSLGGAQKYYKVTPDLACFGKAIANGMPISALVGKRKYMKKLSDIFYSFTSGGEALSIAAAIATINEIEKKKVINIIWKRGKYLQLKVRALIIKNNLEHILALKGAPCWQILNISKTKNCSDLEIKSFLQQELIQEGILWNGQHNLNFSHTKKDINELVQAYSDILPELKAHIKSNTLKKKLRGKLITNIFKVR